jgi:two-component system LytT family response regulator
MNKTSSEDILRAFLVDDEPLALKRIEKLLASIPIVEVVGTTTKPATAVKFLETENVDVLFLDIQMPGMNGFELLSQLQRQPIIIFTTAYNEYALKAFEVNSIDYLLKPVEPKQIERALNKIMNLRNASKPPVLDNGLQLLLRNLADKLNPSPKELPSRISTRLGDRILFIDLDKIAYFYSEEKLTFASLRENKRYIVDYTIAELENSLASKGYLRIHRATLVNLQFVNELHRWFGGRMLIQLKDKNQTKLTVSREKVGILKQQLGL